MERAICRRGIDTDTVQPGNAVEVYTPDPYAPNVHEIVAVLREARDDRELQASEDRAEGYEWSAVVHEKKITRIDNLIARLED